MKFRVILGVQYYIFDSADEAMRFAITAKVKLENISSYKVMIELVSAAEVLDVGPGEEDLDND